MTSEVFLDDDADLGLVQDRNVAVLGYDGQARAQARCLRDSGVDVRVGVVAGSAGADEAVDDGLRVVTPYEACEEADLLVLSDVASMDPVLDEVVLPNLVAGDAMVLGAEAVVTAPVPAGVDVVRLMPWAAGAVVRREYEQGRGVAAFASVVTDGSGGAWPLALAYARAVGATRAGVLRTSDEHYVKARAAAGERGLAAQVITAARQAFDALVADGCAPEVAYLTCVQGLRGLGAEVAAGLYDAELIRVQDTSVPAAAGESQLAEAAALVRSLTGWERRTGAGLD